MTDDVCKEIEVLHYHVHSTVLSGVIVEAVA
jgi:hypothetical protein